MASFTIGKVLIGSILTDDKSLGVKITPKACWNLKMVASIIYQFYLTLCIKLCPAKDPINDSEFNLKENNEKKDEDDEDGSDSNDKEDFTAKYIGDPVSKLVYSKDDLNYLYTLHYDDVKHIVNELAKVFLKFDNILILSERQRLKEFRMENQKVKI